MCRSLTLVCIDAAMKKILAYLLVSIVLAGAVSKFTDISVPEDVLGTIYTVAGVIFSVGMSIAISPKTDSVANEKMRIAIRSSYLRVRNSFMYLFSICTILFILAEVLTIKALPSFWDILCMVFILVSVVFFIYNFTMLQKLGEQIEDQVLKEKKAQMDLS